MKTNNYKTSVEFDAHKSIKSNSSQSNEKKTDRQIQHRETEKRWGKKQWKTVRVCAWSYLFVYRCCPGLRRIHEEKESFGKIISWGGKKKRENGSAPKHTLLVRSIQKAPLFSISRKEHHQNQIISSSVDVLYSCCQD